MIWEFYVVFKEEMLPVLYKLYEWMEEKDKAPMSLVTGVITEIHKKGKKNNMANYRPLSILNADYKILAKILANRMKGVIGMVVSQTQAYSIPGRDIADTTSSIRDVIEHMRGKAIGIMVNLDIIKLLKGWIQLFV